MARLLAAYLEGLEEEVQQSPGYRVMPGVDKLLPRLVDAGILLGIVSGALEGAAHTKLVRGRLNRFFCFGSYGSDSRDRGTLTRVAIERAGSIHGHPLDASRLLVVGHTPRDIEAAHAAGAVAVGVATGKYSVEQLLAAGADHALATLESVARCTGRTGLSAMPRPARGCSARRRSEVRCVPVLARDEQPVGLRWARAPRLVVVRAQGPDTEGDPHGSDRPSSLCWALP